MFYVIRVICLCMPPQNYMLNVPMMQNFLPFFMNNYSGQTKCPHMWIFVLSAIKVVILPKCITSYVKVSYQHYKFTIK